MDGDIVSQRRDVKGFGIAIRRDRKRDRTPETRFERAQRAGGGSKQRRAYGGRDDEPPNCRRPGARLPGERAPSFAPQRPNGFSPAPPVRPPRACAPPPAAP